MLIVYLNDGLVEADAACIDPFDAGLLHGMGLFETMRAYRGVAFRLDAHLDRLTASAKALGLTLRHSREDITQAVAAVLEANRLTDARVRVTVTAGPIRPDADPDRPSPSTLLVTASGKLGYPPKFYQKGIAVPIAPGRLDPANTMVGHKTLSYWARLMVLQAARRRRFAEALWFSTDGNLAEGCISNVFLVKAGRLLTPPLEAPILPGVTRAAVLELAAANNLPAEERHLKLQEVFDADEIFLTGSVMEILPVIRVGVRDIGNGKVGPVTRTVARLYRELVDREIPR